MGPQRFVQDLVLGPLRASSRVPGTRRGAAASLPVLAPNGHADPIERRPLLEAKQNTSALSEHFAF
jgi:hypothetical protein